jgi:hypothetical protein
MSKSFFHLHTRIFHRTLQSLSSCGSMHVWSDVCVQRLFQENIFIKLIFMSGLKSFNTTSFQSASDYDVSTNPCDLISDPSWMSRRFCPKSYNYIRSPLLSHFGDFYARFMWAQLMSKHRAIWNIYAEQIIPSKCKSSRAMMGLWWCEIKRVKSAKNVFGHHWNINVWCLIASYAVELLT